MGFLKKIQFFFMLAKIAATN